MQRACLLLTGLIAAGCLTEGGADEPAPRFKITAKRPDDKITVRADGATTVIDVHSPFGISRAEVERLDASWPKKVLLRMHLKGLESFEVSHKDLRLNAAVSIRAAAAEVRLFKDGDEQAPLDDRSPFWIDVRMRDQAGQPATRLPLDDGYFELLLPAAFFQGNPATINVSWIDFYRG